MCTFNEHMIEFYICLINLITRNFVYFEHQKYYFVHGELGSLAY